MEQQMEVKTMAAQGPPTAEEYAAMCVDGWRVAHLLNSPVIHKHADGSMTAEPRVIIYLEHAGIIVGGRPN